MSAAPRFRPDDLRRLAVDLGAAAGLVRADAAALAAHLLWHDTAGFPAFGLTTLPDWLERLAAGRVRPSGAARVVRETATTTVLDAQGALGPLALAQGAGMAAQKARELGLGLTRLANLDLGGPAAAVAARLAVGPMAALAIGPGPSWTVALPMDGELPLVHDTDLAAAAPGVSPAGRRKNASVPPPPAWLAALAPPPGGWLVAALAISALEPLTAFHERLAASLPAADAPGVLRPDRWEARRREAREGGLSLDGSALAALRAHAERLGADFPEPLTGG